MTKGRRRVGIFCGKCAFLPLLLSGLCAVCFAQNATTPKTSFTLTICTAKSTFIIGSEIDLNVTQTNVSNHGIYFVVSMTAGESVSHIPIRTTVFNDKGNHVAETPFGRKVHGEEPHKNFFGGSVASSRTLIPPGKSFHYVIPLSREYDLSRPGTYTVQAKERDAWTPQYPWVKSNILTITIKP